MNKETREEYLENLFKLSQNREEDKIKTGEIAKIMDISPPTVTEVLPILEEEGYIEYLPYYGVKLTKKGYDEGKKIVRTHRVLEVFLKKYFSLEMDKLHEKACQMEHIFDNEMINLICKRMDAPEKCPHGKSIPPCEEKKCPITENERISNDYKE